MIKTIFFKVMLPLVNDTEYINAFLLVNKVYEIDDEDFIIYFHKRTLKF